MELDTAQSRYSNLHRVDLKMSRTEPGLLFAGRGGQESCTSAPQQCPAKMHRVKSRGDQLLLPETGSPCYPPLPQRSVLPEGGWASSSTVPTDSYS